MVRKPSIIDHRIQKPSTHINFSHLFPLFPQNFIDKNFHQTFRMLSAFTTAQKTATYLLQVTVVISVHRTAFHIVCFYRFSPETKKLLHPQKVLYFIAQKMGKSEYRSIFFMFLNRETGSAWKKMDFFFTQKTLS